MTDEEFLRHLHRQMEEHKRDQGLTTVRLLERKRREQQSKKPKKPRKTS